MILFIIFNIVISTYQNNPCSSHTTAGECALWGCVWNGAFCTDLFNFHSTCLTLETPDLCMAVDKCDWLVSHKRCVGYIHTRRNGIDPEDVYEAWEEMRDNGIAAPGIVPPPKANTTPTPNVTPRPHSTPYPHTRPPGSILPPIIYPKTPTSKDMQENGFRPPGAHRPPFRPPIIYPQTTVPATASTAKVTEEPTSVDSGIVASLAPTKTPSLQPTTHLISWSNCDNLQMRHQCHGASGEGTACRWDSTQHLCISRDENDEKYICRQYDIVHACEEAAPCVWAFRSKTCVALADVRGGGTQLSIAHLQRTKEVVKKNVIFFFFCFSLGIFISTIFCSFRPKETSANEAILLDNI